MPFLAGSQLSSLPLRPSHCGPQTQVVHKRGPVELLFIVSLSVPFHAFLTPRGVPRGSITASAVEGAKTFLSLTHALLRRVREIHSTSASCPSRTPRDCFFLVYEMGLLFPFVGSVP